MRLTLQTDYALRILMYLGVTQDRLVTIKEISESFDISKNHLMKLVHQMAKLGYVDTVRGMGGGMRLGLELEAINIGTLVRKIEPDMSLVECFMEHGSCRIEPGCKLKHIMQEALAAFLSVLDNYTMADLVKSPRGISSLLGLSLSNK